MAESVTYLITGANRGIGLGLTATLLLRPNTTVIATIRDVKTSTTSLTALPIAAGSKLHIIPFTLDLTSPSTSSEALLSALSSHNITKINTLILNAGIGSSFLSTLTTPLASMTQHFETNALLPIHLFQTLFPLLSSTSDVPTKVFLISSSLGSIGDMDALADTPSLAYGKKPLLVSCISKASANYLMRKLHFEYPSMISLVIHPGWVKTANGQAFADSIGVEEPPMTLEVAVDGIVTQIDGATREGSSGKFVAWDGRELKW